MMLIHLLEKAAMPALKVVVAAVVLWVSSGCTKDQRFSSGAVTGVLSCLATFTLLDPMFHKVGLDIAEVATYLLGLFGAFVGLTVGTLLPIPSRGACLGAVLGVLLSCVRLPKFEIVTPTLIFCGAIFSVKFKGTAKLVLVATSMLIGGAIAACIIQPELFSEIESAIRYSEGESFPPLKAILIWIGASFVAFLLWCYRFGITDITQAFRALRSAHQPASGNSSSNGAPKGLSTNAQKNRFLAKINANQGIDTYAYNMFDPAELPPRLAEYAGMVYSACEDLGNFFGFQDSSVRNEAEHLLCLLSNHRRYMTVLPLAIQPPSPIHALHAKVFSNYMKWCKSMGISPNFSKANPMATFGPPAAMSRVFDLVLFFCIWGECANIRHMPEMLWWLYHKTMESLLLQDGMTQTRSLYDGHFLDHVVTPIYEVVKKSMQSNKDHPDKRNYDDFNEFFWSRECLTYRYSALDESELQDAEEGVRTAAAAASTGTTPIAVALAGAGKTYLEKRSWTRGILALNRIIEWHFITFYILSVIAFSNELVWGWVYSVQVLSGVFWLLNLLHLTWGLLEVWCIYPGIYLSGSAICGYLFSSLTRFLILVYQTLYLMYTFGPKGKTYFDMEDKDSNFWWWQYIWLSVLCMIPYFIEALLQLYPAMTTKLYTSQNDYIQSFLNVLFPLSRLYVAKELHESLRHTLTYILFWITLIAWKLYFSYIFEVDTMVLPTLQLTDDYVNLRTQNFWQMGLLLILRWSPQFVVYMIDMSIWYAVWQAFAGTAGGFKDHLGDVRSINDIRENFTRAPENFCKKMLSPDAGSRRGSSASFLKQNSQGDITTEGAGAGVNESSALLGSDPQKLQSYVNRLLDVRIQKWVMFSAVWNEIIDHFRQEDIISNREMEYLKFSRFDGFNQAIYLPVFQTAGVVENALNTLELPHAEEGASLSDEQLFKPVLENVTMRTAVSEVWELGSYVFVKMLGQLHADDVSNITGTFLKWAQAGELCNHAKMERMRSVMTQFVNLITCLEKGLGRRKPSSKPRVSTNNRAGKQDISSSKLTTTPSALGGGVRRTVSAGSLAILGQVPKEELDAAAHESQQSTLKQSKKQLDVRDALRDQVRDKLRGVLNSLKGMISNAESDAQSRDVLDRLTFVMSMENGFMWDDAYASDQLDEVAKNSIFNKVLTKVHGLVACYPDDVEPKSKEARRRLTFFVNTLFMDMPDAPSIHDMFSWNVLTPFYSEDVTYNKNDLEKRTDELGVSTLLYLQTLYRADWNNFMERMGLQDDEKIWSKKYIEETRLWASLRAQTLTRTVNGMMYFEKALRLLANLERLDDETTNDLMGEKFGYIVACQVYGRMKKEQDPKADDIDKLMHRYPHMRVAYIDTVRLNRSGDSLFYSVLVKSDRRGGIQEVYRVRLPGNPILGEGKPENQNHALIFSRGEFVQTIDMNQEGYFEEALKMRNALQEFAKREGPLPTTILGLREHIFTGSVSSLANYMALQETSFVTLGQRVLANPLFIRLHYGHPDVFDKLFFMTRGGISKSSKGINLSEDIFAGYNNVVRGGQVAFKEYLQVGKGRDVGMSQIYKFEAKLSQGAAEQSLSRDIYRVCHRLDFWRLLSLYYGGIGHYFSNVLTVLTVYIVVYLMAILALFDLEKIGERVITPMGTIQMLLGGLGLLQTIPLFATLGVERGWWPSAKEIFQVFVTGGPLHFMFHIQTKAYYMSQTILVGGAKYRPTGRGFVTQHTPFDEQYRFFASSHLYLGVELGAGLVLMGLFTDAGQYFGRTWSLWLASVSFLASPFWFNPLSFDWNVVVSDYDKFLRWMQCNTGGASKSWNAWWVEENNYWKGMKMEAKNVFIIKAILYAVIGEGIRRSDLLLSDITLHKPLIAISQVIIFLFVLLGLGRLYMSSEQTMPYPLRRTTGILICVGLVAGVFTIFVEDTNFLRYALAGYYGLGALCQLGLLMGVQVVQPFYLIHDYVCGHIIFIPLFLLSALQLPHYIQTWLLYHNALSSDVVVSDILRYARKTQETAGSNEPNDDLVEQVAELRKIVQKQEDLLNQAGLQKVGSFSEMSGGGAPGTDNNGPARIMAPTPLDSDIQPQRRDEFDKAKRVMSMSGIDVWSDMAGTGTGQSVGNTAHQGQSQGFGSGTLGEFSFTQPDTMPPR